MRTAVKMSRGFTLIEAMVIVVLIGVMLSFGIPAYSNWRRAHEVQEEILRLFNDLQQARLLSYSEKVTHGLWWGNAAPITSYQLRRDDNGNGNVNDGLGAGGDTLIDTTAPKYSITRTGALISVSFDGRGFANNQMSFRITTITGSGMDCVDVSWTRVIAGKWNATSNTCIPK